MTSAKEWSEPTLGFLVHDVARLMRKRLEQRARAAGIGLTRAQWQALAYLARSEGINQTCLAQLLDIEPITLVRLLDRLEAHGTGRAPAGPARSPPAQPVPDREGPGRSSPGSSALGAEVREEALAGLDDDERERLLTMLDTDQDATCRRACAVIDEDEAEPQPWLRQPRRPRSRPCARPVHRRGQPGRRRAARRACRAQEPPPARPLGPAAGRAAPGRHRAWAGCGSPAGAMSRPTTPMSGPTRPASRPTSAGLVASIEVQRQRAGDDRARCCSGSMTPSYRIALDPAEAELGMARSDLEALRASYAQKQAEIAKARDDIAFYEKEFSRQQDLAGRRVSPQSQLDAARHNLDAARSAGRGAGAGAGRHRGPARRRARPAPVERHPRYRAALAARDQAARDLDHTVVRAPIDGIVTQVLGPPAGRVPAGGPGGLRAGCHRPCLDRGQPEGDRPHLGAARASRSRSRSTPIPAASGTASVAEPEPGEPGAVLAAAGAERERQLGQGRAAHTLARAGRDRGRTSRRCAPA